jgi:hypothetical protein
MDNVIEIRFVYNENSQYFLIIDNNIDIKQYIHILNENFHKIRTFEDHLAVSGIFSIKYYDFYMFIRSKNYKLIDITKRYYADEYFAIFETESNIFLNDLKEYEYNLQSINNLIKEIQTDVNFYLDNKWIQLIVKENELLSNKFDYLINAEKFDLI